MMDVHIQPLTDASVVRRACEMTMHGQKSKVTLAKLYRAEHSPIRCMIFWVELRKVPSFVATHLVRHKHGIEPFVQSMRDDLYLKGQDVTVTRNTPVNLGLFINAQALITISRKRLCLKSHAKTVATWTKLRKAMRAVDSDLANAMVPDCAYRGFCPEMRVCRPGADAVIRAYANGNPAYRFRLPSLTASQPDGQ